MNDRKKAGRLVDGAFSLCEEDLKEINGLFRAYLFRRSSTGEIWSTCCGRNMRIDDRTRKVWERGAEERLATREEMDLLLERHTPQAVWKGGKCVNEFDAMKRVKCPWCGAKARMKDLRYCGQRKNLREYQRAAVLRQREDGLWVQCYDCVKDYSCGELTDRAKLDMLGVYRFCGQAMMPCHGASKDNPPALRATSLKREALGRTVAESAQRHWYGTIWGYNEIYMIGTKQSWMLSAPYGRDGELGMRYSVVGVRELQKSALRWIGLEELVKKYDLFRMLSLACFYPRQMEWLHRLGLDEGIGDFTERGVKNAAAISWDSENPKNFLGLGKPELRTLRERKGDLTGIALFRSCKGAEALEDCITLTQELYDRGKEKKLVKILKAYGIRLPKLLRYAENQQLENQSLRTVLMEYIDYAQAAIGIGLDLRNPVFAFPKCFPEKHDSVTKAYADLLKARANEKEWEEYKPRYKKLEKKYLFALEGFEIRVPMNSSEIVEEGKQLHHCVGGYASRHIKGTTTILFLRRTVQRDVPLATIEMRGNKIVQIHGFDDERTACPENPNKTPCRQLYDYFLEPWLQWLAEGSKRDKEGNPVVKESVKEYA